MPPPRGKEATAEQTLCDSLLPEISAFPSWFATAISRCRTSMFAHRNLRILLGNQSDSATREERRTRKRRDYTENRRSKARWRTPMVRSPFYVLSAPPILG